MLKKIEKRKIIIIFAIFMLPLIIPMFESIIKIIFEIGKYCGMAIHNIVYGC